MKIHPAVLKLFTAFTCAHKLRDLIGTEKVKDLAYRPSEGRYTKVNMENVDTHKSMFVGEERRIGKNLS
jgi:hypothetical protein